jgi:hypothetical protein
MPTREMIERTFGPDGFASKAILNPWAVYWNDPYWRPKMQDLMYWLKECNVDIFVRLDDPRTTKSWRGNPGSPASVGDRWINAEHRDHIRNMMIFHGALKAQYGSGFACMIHNNEPWVEGPAQLVYEGEREITAPEYVDWLRKSRAIIKEFDASMPVIMAGITTVTEERFLEKLRKLEEAGLFKTWDEDGTPITNAVHIHEYEEAFGLKHISIFDAIAKWTHPLPLIVGEVGHKEAMAARDKPEEAFAVIMKAWKFLSGIFGTRMAGFFPFALNTIQHDPGLEPIWEIYGTPLRDMLKAEVVG